MLSSGDWSPLEPELLEFFYQMHECPEIAFQEFETTKRIRAFLLNQGIEVLSSSLETGLLAQVKGNRPGKTIALRCDIDALPLEELTALPYKSRILGRMHACGHDFHTTALLGVAVYLQNHRDFAGTVKLIFQPAEEGGNGAERVINTKLLEDVTAVFGMHVTAEMPVGSVTVCHGSPTAAVGFFTFQVTGKGGHASVPHLCKDSIVAAADIISSAQTIVSRRVNPFEEAVLSFTHVEAGTNWNILPDTAFMEGTIRTFRTDLFTQLANWLGDVGKGVALATDTQVDYQWNLTSPATHNDPGLTTRVQAVLDSSGYTFIPYVPTMIGEDFSLYQDKIPGVFWQLGVGSPSGLHTQTFEVDLTALPIAVDTHLRIAMDALL
jgi:amidohydrolase